MLAVVHGVHATDEQLHDSASISHLMRMYAHPPFLIYMSGLLFENNKHAIAKVRENANRHGGKNATITK